MNQGYFVYYTLPLGWETGAYVYHTTGLLATSCIIILGVHPIPHTVLQRLSCRPGYGAQGTKPFRKSSSTPPCASVGWSTFLPVHPFFNVRPSRRLEAQDEGLNSVIHPDSGYCGSRSLQRLAGKTTLFSRLYFTPGPRHLAIPLSSP